MNTRSAILTLISLLAAFALSGGFYVFNLLTSDNLKFKKGDVAHALIIRSGTIRNFPTFDRVSDDVRFTYRARDGTAPEEIVMTYDSSLSIDDLLHKLKAHCESQNYDEVPEDKFLLRSQLACDAPDYRIEINMQLPRYDATRVTVTFLDNRV